MDDTTPKTKQKQPRPLRDIKITRDYQNALAKAAVEEEKRLEEGADSLEEAHIISSTPLLTEVENDLDQLLLLDNARSEEDPPVLGDADPEALALAALDAMNGPVDPLEAATAMAAGPRMPKPDDDTPTSMLPFPPLIWCIRPVVKFCRKHFCRSNALHCAASARILIPAECSAIL